MQDRTETHEKRPHRGGRGKLAAVLTGAALVVGGAVGAQAITDGKAFEHVRAAAFEGGGWRGREHRPLHELSEAEIEDRISRMVRHVSIEIDGTPEQEQQIIAVLTDTALEMRSLKDRMEATRLELQSLLTADAIDRQALEALRASRLAEADRISKTLVDTVADVAEVLTPEQRETLQALIRERRERHGPGHGHWRRGG